MGETNYQIKMKRIKKAVIFLCSVVIMIWAQFPPPTTTSTQKQVTPDGETKKSDEEKPQVKQTKLADSTVEKIEVLIDENKGLYLKIAKPKNNSLWRFMEGVEYNKENWLAAELWRLDKEEEENYPLVRLYIRVFDNQLLEHLYKKEKYKNWKEFWKKTFLDYEIGDEKTNAIFPTENAKIEKNLIDASYKIGGKKSTVTEYQIVGTPRGVSNVSYRVRAIIFKDKQYTIMFRAIMQVGGKELSKMIEEELMEILNNTSFIEIKKKK